MPLDNVPVEVGRPAARGSLGALAEPPVDLGLPAIPTGRPRPIDVESTLGSPFEREAAARASVLSHRDQPYGTQGHARQAFDVHLPAACSGGPLPLVVWIHGDDWRSGSKADCPLLWLVDQGYAVASIGYRLSDAAVFPAQLDDCRAALATLERDADIWGIDRQRICVIGSGAGGHLAALVGFAQPGTEPAPGEPPRREAIAAVCAIAAATHLASLGPAHERSTSAASRLVGGPLPELREAAQAASPLEHVSADDPPTLLVHGGRDADVPAAQAMRLDRALSSTGVDSTLLLLDEAGHALPLSRESAAGQGVLGFLDRVLGPGLRRESPPAVPVDPPAQ
jgi:acetyl esterase/lipase